MARLPLKENLATFLARLRSAGFSERDVHLIHAAYIIAKAEFRSMSRKERDAYGNAVRYFEHLRRVAIILVELGCRDRDEIIAALLHDLVEDTRLTVAFVEAVFGPAVAHRVSQVSKVPKEGYLERLVAFATWETLRLKGCDRLDNLRSLSAGSLEFRRKQIAETEDHYYALFDRMVRECPPARREHVDLLRRLIHEEVANQRRLLERDLSVSA